MHSRRGVGQGKELREVAHGVAHLPSFSFSGTQARETIKNVLRHPRHHYAMSNSERDQSDPQPKLFTYASIDKW